MFLDITHEEFDYKNRYHKSYNHTSQQDSNFHTGKMEAKLYNLQQTCAEHNGNCQKECKFCCYGSGYPQKQCTNDGRTGTGCTGENCRDELEYPNQQGKLECDFLQAVDTCSFSFMTCFNDQKRDTKTISAMATVV